MTQPVWTSDEIAKMVTVKKIIIEEYEKRTHSLYAPRFLFSMLSSFQKQKTIYLGGITVQNFFNPSAIVNCTNITMQIFIEDKWPNQEDRNNLFDWLSVRTTPKQVKMKGKDGNLYLDSVYIDKIQSNQYHVLTYPFLVYREMFFHPDKKLFPYINGDSLYASKEEYDSLCALLPTKM